ncbi:uncharacterized protein LOC102804019 [Saccoglossus kowalevskii]
MILCSRMNVPKNGFHCRRRHGSSTLVMYISIYVLYFGLASIVGLPANETTCSLKNNGTMLDCSNLGIGSLPGNLSSDITTLILRGNNLTVLEDSAFKGLVNLEHLDLSHNYISDIALGAFEGLDRLNVLKLSHNDIYIIPITALIKTPMLQELYTDNNLLRDVPKALTKLHNLLYLDLSYNKIPQVNFDQTFQSLKTLDVLNLAGNTISTIHNDDFIGFNGTKLLRLDLSHNNLQTVNQEAFHPFMNIHTLDLSGTLLTPSYVGEVLYGLQNVQLQELILREIGWQQLTQNTFQAMTNSTLCVLDLSQNYLSIITAHLLPLPNLRQLNLAYNSIGVIHSGAFDNLMSLTILNLTANYLTTYPNFKPLQNTVQTIDLSDNKLTGEIPIDAFKGLERLSSLDMSVNNINGMLKSGIFNSQSKSLHKLDLSYNKIEQFAENVFYNTTVLRMIDLSHNNLSKIDGTIPYRHLFDCTHLDLSHNNISQIVSNAFFGMNALQYLDLSYNALNVGGLFEYNSTVFLPIRNSLSNLVLSGNNLDSIHPGTFQVLYNLKNLDLADNNIEVLGQGLFKDLSNLEVLELQYNLIRTVNKTTFAGLHSLQELNMAENQFSCTCELEWFLYWLEETNVTVVNASEYVCMYPYDLQGDLITTFDPEISCNKGAAQIISLCLVILTVFCVVVIIACRAKKACEMPKGTRLNRYSSVPYKTPPSPLPHDSIQPLNSYISDEKKDAVIPMEPVPKRKKYSGNEKGNEETNGLLQNNLESDSEDEIKLDNALQNKHPQHDQKSGSDASATDVNKNKEKSEETIGSDSDSSVSSSASSKRNSESADNNDADNDEKMIVSESEHEDNHYLSTDSLDQYKGNEEEQKDEEESVFTEESELMRDDSENPNQTPIDPQSLGNLHPIKYSV